MVEMLKYSVILCEDEPLLLEVLGRKVERASARFQVTGLAANGQEALDMLEEGAADLLITDIRMPVMDGISLLRAVYEQNLRVSCVLLSGHSEFQYAQDAMRLGAVDYLLKPVSDEEIAQLLARQCILLDAERDALQLAFAPPEDVTVESALELMRQYIQTNACQPINFNMLCASLNYSVSYISRLFAKRYGMPPQRYQTQLRMNEAKRLLLMLPQQSVREIAEHVGYPDQGYFTRIFKQITGKSPQQFRASS